MRVRMQADLPGGSDGKESACGARDPGLIPALRRSPGEGNACPLQHSCLENPMNRGSHWATVHGVVKSQTCLSNCHFHFFKNAGILSHTNLFLKMEKGYKEPLKVEGVWNTPLSACFWGQSQNQTLSLLPLASLLEIFFLISGNSVSSFTKGHNNNFVTRAFWRFKIN